MRSICKKVIAFCLVAALALTCFAGALSVSAETYNASISIDPVAIKVGDPEAAVILKITSSEAGINEALIQVSSDIGAVASEATIVDETGAPVDAEAIDYYIDYAQDATNFGTFYLSGRTIDSAITSAYIKVVFATGKAAAGTYPIDIDVTGVKAASSAEDIITLNYVESAITVKAPHVHNEVWTSDEAGNHTSSCDAADCEGFTPVTEPCADGEDADLLCDKCGYDMTPAEEECEHVYDATDAINYVNFTAEGIEYYEICSECDEHIVTSIDASETAVTVANKALAQDYISAINVTEAGTYTIAVDDAIASTDLRYAYVKGDKIVANGYHSSLTDGNAANGENAFAATYADTDATITTGFAGIFVAFVPADVSKLPTATIGISQTFNLASSIAFNFMVNKTNLGNFESVYALIDHEAYDGNVYAPVNDYLVDTYTISEDDKYYVFSYPISAYQMNDDVSATYYGVLDGIDYTVRQKVDFSLVAYSISNNTGYLSADNGLKTLLSTMFEYGTVAQKAFLYRTDAYVTDNTKIVAHLENYQAAETVAKEDIATMEVKTNHLDSSSKKFGVSKGLNTRSTVEVYYRMNVKNFIAAYGEEELENITFKIYYKKPSTTEANVDFEVEDYTINTAYDHTTDANGNYYWFKADKITASMMTSETKIEAWYNAEKLVDSNYTINNYLVSNYDSAASLVSNGLANLGDICKAIATYGDVARDYFKVIS